MGTPSPATEQIVRRIERHLGSELFQRVIVLPNQHVRQYYQYLSVTTVVLNSPVYSGEITAVDAFLYDVPLVTQTGNFLFQRYTSAFYDDFRIVGPACTTKDEYILQAVKLGTDAEYRRLISQKISENRSRFFENGHVIREWERFFEKASREKPIAGRKVHGVPPASVVPMRQLEINVACECNLKCSHCSHFCDRMSGLVPVEKLAEDFRTWNSKLAPGKIRLIGGEPLLHPELDIVIRETKSHWPNSQIELVTNGLLIPQRREIPALLKELGGHVVLSRHFDHAEYLEAFQVGLQCLQAAGIGFTIYTSDREWRKYYELDDDGLPLPYHSDPEKAWRNCRTKNLCPTLWDNRLWKCQHLAWSLHAFNAGQLPQPWQVVCDDRPLPPESTPHEIMAFLSSEAVPGCRICPESYDLISLPEKHSISTSAAKPGSAAS
ncbi:MAG: radical SAM protein [Planctomycetaceae bacterium]|nr:radical SAM protein [Planctomycetaceae bacterium]